MTVAPMMTHAPTLAAETRPTPQANIEALLFALRRGLSSLDDPGNLDRLRHCDAAAVEQVALRLRSWGAKRVAYLPVYSDDDIETLLRVWRALREREAA